MRKTLQMAMVAAIILLAGSPANADATYTYAGNPFVYNGSVYALTGVQGSFTIASPLVANTTVDVTPLSYSFTDGNAVWNQGNYAATGTPFTSAPTQFTVTTDSAGIVAWDVDIFAPFGEITTCTACNVGAALDATNLWNNYDGYSIPTVSGTWAGPTPTPQDAPEPSSLLLLSSGLFGLGVLRKRHAA